MTACSSELTVKAEIDFVALGTTAVAPWPPTHPSKGRASARAAPRLERDSRVDDAIKMKSRCEGQA